MSRRVGDFDLGLEWPHRMRLADLVHFGFQLLGKGINFNRLWKWFGNHWLLDYLRRLRSFSHLWHCFGMPDLHLLFLFNLFDVFDLNWLNFWLLILLLLLEAERR